jgi:hypothetical protein
MLELQEDGRQLVKVTKVHRKNTKLMHPELTPWARYIDDFTTPPAPPDTFLTWTTRYLKEKDSD